MKTPSIAASVVAPRAALRAALVVALVVASVVASGLTTACGGAPKSPAPEPPAPHADPPVVSAPPPAPAVPVSARDAAIAEVARLTALADQDPYLAPWTGPYGGVPPWDKLKVEAFPKAFEIGIALHARRGRRDRREPGAGRRSRTRSSRSTTPGATRAAPRRCSRSWSSNLSTPEVQAVDKEWSPKLAAARDKITFNDKLFARMTAVYAARDQLEPEQRRLVELRYDRFVRAGAKAVGGGQGEGRQDQRGARRPVRRVQQEGARRRELVDRARRRAISMGCRRRSRRATPRRPPSASSRASGRWSTRGRASIRSSRRRRAAICARRCGRRSRTAATTATTTTPTRRSRGSSSCGPSARGCSATRRTRTGECPTRWRAIPRRPRS